MTTTSKKIFAQLKQKLLIPLFRGHISEIKWRLKDEKSYSQCGEDLIIEYVFKCLGVKQPTYLDIGANSPTFLSNTYHFYVRGSKGVLVEPNADLCKQLVAKRERDICLNVGVGTDSATSADFYIMTSHTLSTFSKEEAFRYQSYGKQKIQNVINLPLVSVNDIMRDYFDGAPDFISLDVEGMDYTILAAIDFDSFRPTVFCVETLTYTEDCSEEKIKKIIDFLLGKGYMLYADTYINSIFVDKTAWKNRG